LLIAIRRETNNLLLQRFDRMQATQVWLCRPMKVHDRPAVAAFDRNEYHATIRRAVVISNWL
jgi:hypothetical protein